MTPAKTTFLLAILLAFMATGVASAETALDGEALLKICGNAVRALEGETAEKEAGSDLPYCLGFVTAVRQTIEEEARRGEKFQEDGVECRWHYETGWTDDVQSVMRELFRPVCYPGSLSPERIARMVVAFIERHPEEKRLPAAAIVAAAIREPFPCVEE